jgi:acetone carboxylase beta subunit
MAGKALVRGIDAGGTMTDTFIVDEAGGFTVGKAATTPHDESLGFLESAQDAMSYWKVDGDQLYPTLDVALYSGTTMLNTLLRRRGQKVGLITTRGFEDDILMAAGCRAGLVIRTPTEFTPSRMFIPSHWSIGDAYGVLPNASMFSAKK